MYNSNQTFNMESQFLNITHIRDLTISIDFNNLNIMKALKIKIEIKIKKTICKFSQEKKSQEWSQEWSLHKISNIYYFKRTIQGSSKYCVMGYYISQTPFSSCHACVKWRVVSCHTELFGSTQSLELGNVTRAIEIWAIYIHWTQWCTTC